MHKEVYLVRVDDDGSHTDVGLYPTLTAAVADGEEITAYDDHDFCYEAYSLDGTRLAQIHPGRVGYREWARRSGRLDTIHAQDDRYDHDVDELLVR